MIIVLEEIGGSVCQNDIQVNVETLLTPGRAWLAKRPPSIRFTNEHLKKKKKDVIPPHFIASRLSSVLSLHTFSAHGRQTDLELCRLFSSCCDIHNPVSTAKHCGLLPLSTNLWI